MHDASHGAISGGDDRLHGLEQALGWLAGVPLCGPFPVFRSLHLRHHAHTNDPALDPDHWVVGRTLPETLLRCLLLMPRYYWDFLFGAGARAPGARRSLPIALGFVALLLAAIVALTAAGLGRQVLLLWLLPALLASGLLGLAFDWLPHHPHTSRERYRDTRVLLLPGLTPLLLWQNYHLVHHLYPRVPFFRYGRVFHALRAELERHGAPIEGWSRDLPRPLRSVVTLHVEAVERRGPDVVVLTLQRRDGRPWAHLAGQYLRLHVDVDGEVLPRCYSLCTAPAADGPHVIAVKRVAGGRVSNWLYEHAHVGMTLRSEAPAGRFTLEPATAPATLVLIGGGSGVTPLLAMARTALRDAPATQIAFLLGNRDAQSNVFAAELAELATASDGRLRVRHVLERAGPDWTGARGRLDAATLAQELDAAGVASTAAATPIRYALCGPAPMMQAVRQALLARGVAPASISEERFVAATLPGHDAAAADGTAWPVRYQIGGAVHEVVVPAGQTFLQAARARGVPLAWSCGVGNCGSCRMRLVEGAFAQAEVPALLESERQAGHFLACSARPTAACHVEQR